MRIKLEKIGKKQLFQLQHSQHYLYSKLLKIFRLLNQILMIYRTIINLLFNIINSLYLFIGCFLFRLFLNFFFTTKNKENLQFLFGGKKIITIFVEEK